MASVTQRRAMWAANDAADGNVCGWVCERCGDTNEEGLAIYARGRATRSDPSGTRTCHCLCHRCVRAQHVCVCD